VESGWQLLVVAAAPLVGWLAARSDAPAARKKSDESQAAGADDAPTDDGPAEPRDPPTPTDD
jgi:hypothetical protein